MIAPTVVGLNSASIVEVAIPPLPRIPKLAGSSPDQNPRILSLRGWLGVPAWGVGKGLRQRGEWPESCRFNPSSNPESNKLVPTQSTWFTNVAS